MTTTERPLFFTTLPVSSDFGWGICGRNLLRELGLRGRVSFVYDKYCTERSTNAIEDAWMHSTLATPEDLALYQTAHNHPTFIPITEFCDLAASPGGGTNVVGVAFNLKIFEESIPQLRDRLAYIAAGSEWSRDLFEMNGIRAVAAPQGVDQALFNESFAEKSLPDDKFLIYSGGKFEFRKGQDYVIRAVQHMQQKYKDVWLVAQWYNQWVFSYNSMTRSDKITFTPADHALTQQEYVLDMGRTLVENGIDPNRVILAPNTSQALAPILIRETDIGIFPNRIEGGTNLMLMEYMACGKPAIATAHTGHLDVVNDRWALCLKNNTPVYVQHDHPAGYDSWFEVDVDELIAHLEWAYNNRNAAKGKGQRAAVEMKKFTWTSCVDRMLKGPV